MNIGIFGAGWLGKQLARVLQQQGYEGKVTASSEEGKEKLTKQGFNAFSVKVSEDGIYGDLDFFRDVEVLIISLPPVPPAFFEPLIRYMDEVAIKKGILFSSTGIYAEGMGTVNEAAPLQLSLPKVKRLKDIEDLFLEQPGLSTTVLRLGGLWGPDRHPVHFLARKEVIEDADEPVNLVHRDTVCRVVLEILSRTVNSVVFNVVDEDHRSREEFYTAAAKEKGLVLPPFRKSGKPLHRVVSGEKLWRFLN